MVDVALVSVALVDVSEVKAAVSAVSNVAKRFVEVALVKVAFVPVSPFREAVFANRLVMLPFVIVDDAAVVVEKVVVAENEAGDAVVKVPET